MTGVALDGPAGRCRSCDADIVWAHTVGGKTMPMDPVSVDDGNVVVVGTYYPENRNPMPRVKVLKASEPAALFDDRELFKSHFATCPNRDRHRRSR